MLINSVGEKVLLSEKEMHQLLINRIENKDDYNIEDVSVVLEELEKNLNFFNLSIRDLVLRKHYKND